MKLFLIGSVSVTDTDPVFSDQRNLLRTTMKMLGADIAGRGHTLLACSPFPDSADWDAAYGAKEQLSNRSNITIEFYYPNSPKVAEALSQLENSLKPIDILTVACAPPADEASREAWSNAWLLAQLTAMDSSNGVIAIGGKLTGSMSLLLRLAEARGKILLPFRYLKGAAAQLYDRQHFLLRDVFSDEEIDYLNKPDGIAHAIDLLEKLARRQTVRPEKRSNYKFFISYPKAAPESADYVEMLLRRRNQLVYRDDRDFGAGSDVVAEIDNRINESHIFIALWCKDYACSPWCFDELATAIELQEAKKLKIWLLCTDSTRMVPPKLRRVLSYPVQSRKELEGQLLKLLDEQLNF